MAEQGLDWTGYQQALDRVRARLLGLPAAAGPDGIAAVDRLMAEACATAFNLVIAPDPARPALLSSTVFSPGTYDWMMPNPDFLYRYAFLDPRYRYRLTGRRGTSAFLDAQTIAGFFGDPDLKLLDSHMLDAMIGEEGAIDVELGADRPAQGARWIPLERDRMNSLILREAFFDWSNETGADLTLSILDPAPARREDAAGTAARLAAAVRMIDFCLTTFGPHFCQSVVDRCGENRFVHVDTSRDEDASNPGVAYLPAAFRLDADEALLLSFPVPQARYWSVHLTDRLSRTLDYAGRQTSLNNRQVLPDANGMVHILVSSRDPGFANWLDAGGLSEGMMLLRWYGAQRVMVPEVQRIKMAAIADALPPHAFVIGSEKRRSVIAARAAAIARRWR